MNTAIENFEKLKHKAEQGDAFSQTTLGLQLLQQGPFQFKCGALGISKAANQGRADAQYLLGYCYENGVGVSTCNGWHFYVIKQPICYGR